MNKADYNYLPKEVDDIVIRDFAFDFPDDLNPLWAYNNPVRSHMFNGFSLVMPYLEPFLIRTIARAREHVSDPQLLSDMKGFNAQEGNHYRCHRRFNELVKANGYPELARIEERMTVSYAKLAKKSLRTQLAYAAGFECMTNGFTHWFINKRVKLFGGGCPYVASFWVMHMIEEAEHKTVAFDVYMACFGHYWPRVFGVFHGSFHVLGLGVMSMFQSLKKDRLLHKPSSWWAIIKEMVAMNINVGAFAIRALSPWFNPRQEKDPEWMKQWLKGYNTLPKGELIPLMDTEDAIIPVPF